MISSLISRLVILVFGTLYPAYSSYKAVKSKDIKLYVKWMMYWIVFALFTAAETFTDIFFSFWFPFYYELKVILVIWLLSPVTRGSSIMYRRVIHPLFMRREQEIDELIAKAKDQGYNVILDIGCKGMTFATNAIMSTAVKGSTGLLFQLRKSYSLNDLVNEDVNNRDNQFARIKDCKNNFQGCDESSKIQDLIANQNVEANDSNTRVYQERPLLAVRTGNRSVTIEEDCDDMPTLRIRKSTRQELKKLSVLSSSYMLPYYPSHVRKHGTRVLFPTPSSYPYPRLPRSLLFRNKVNSPKSSPLYDTEYEIANNLDVENDLSIKNDSNLPKGLPVRRRGHQERLPAIGKLTSSKKLGTVDVAAGLRLKKAFSNPDIVLSLRQHTPSNRRQLCSSFVDDIDSDTCLQLVADGSYLPAGAHDAKVPDDELVVRRKSRRKRKAPTPPTSNADGSVAETENISDKTVRGRLPVIFVDEVTGTGLQRTKSLDNYGRRSSLYQTKNDINDVDFANLLERPARRRGKSKIGRFLSNSRALLTASWKNDEEAVGDRNDSVRSDLIAGASSDDSVSTTSSYSTVI